MKVAIIKYNAGNTQSVIYALERLGITPVLTNHPDELRSADKIIFPGVGEAQSTMKHLRELQLDQFIPSLTQPLLGICLGMQLMCEYSEENDTQCLGIFRTPVKKFIPENLEKVPHMGWNDITVKNNSWLGQEMSGSDMYFVHSYYVPLIEETVASCEYITAFSAALQKDNFYAVQFHPEKSSTQGLEVIQRFLEV